MQPGYRARPGHAWAIARRYHTYRRMRRYGKALADIKRLFRLKELQASQDLAAE